MTFGQWGEGQACRFLKRKGYRIVERNFRCRGGELDIVAEKGDTLCFVEVKSRRSTLLGRPAEAVTTQKQRRMRSAAAFYLQKNAGRVSSELQLRMDVVEVLRLGETTYIQHIENAF